MLEDVARFVFGDPSLARSLKDLRHKVRVEPYAKYLSARDIKGDCLKQSSKSELQRDSLAHIVLVNFKRSQESARVLEESFKLLEPHYSALFKQIRYELYNLEINFKDLGRA